MPSYEIAKTASGWVLLDEQGEPCSYPTRTKREALAEVECRVRREIIEAIQKHCADVHECGREWDSSDGEYIASLLNRSDNPRELFRFIDEKTGDFRVGYRTRDGREWFHILRQMRNTVGSGLLENLRY